MSILLEALRKSEKNQHLHEAPTIHSDDQSGPVSEPLNTGALVVLLVLALFASGWFVWNQYQAPEGIYQPPVTLAGDKGGRETRAVETASPPDQGAAPAALADDTAVKTRTPMESYQPPVNEDAPQETVVTKTPESAATAIRPDTRPLRSEPDGVGEAAPATASAGQPAEPAKESYHPGEPAPIGYWDLPDSIRELVPEIKFSVLVYAKDPADRFVLINGERMEEGDSPQSGLVVEEIRRDGVLFSYRLYRFLVER